MSDTSKLLHDARQWIEQEATWDGEIYANPSPSSGEGGRRPGEGSLVKIAPPHPDPLPRRGEGVKATPTKKSVVPPLREDPAKTVALQALYEKYKDCTRCTLGATRLKFVFGVGSPNAQVMFIGEGPGYEEDHRGEPFIGKAGQLLDKIIESIGLSRKTVYIANIVKCHAMVNPQDPELRGNDRPPTPFESETCSPILQQQIAIIQPRVIVTLGSPSTKALLKTEEGITKVRGKLFPLPLGYFKAQPLAKDMFDAPSNEDFPGLSNESLSKLGTIQVLPTYHPAALLRNPNLKKDTWEDMKRLRDILADGS